MKLFAHRHNTHRLRIHWMRCLRIVWLCAIMLMPPSSNSLSHAAEASEQLVKTDLDIAFVQNIFNGVNPSDAEAALKVFGKTIGGSYGYTANVRVHMFKHARELASPPYTGNIELIIMDSWSYLEIDHMEWIEPLYFSLDTKQVANRYLLLTRSGSHLDSVIDLRGKSLNLFTSANAMLGLHWLESLLLERHLDEPETFFGRLDYQYDPMPAILQVFFGKKDAALIYAPQFELMAELNPQLNSLRAIETSQPFVNSIICIKRSGWSPVGLKKDLIRVIDELHLNPAAEQLFTLFKLGDLTPFDPNLLDTVRQLRRKTMAAAPQSTGQPVRLDASKE